MRLVGKIIAECRPLLGALPLSLTTGSLARVRQVCTRRTPLARSSDCGELRHLLSLLSLLSLSLLLLVVVVVLLLLVLLLLSLALILSLLVLSLSLLLVVVVLSLLLVVVVLLVLRLRRAEPCVDGAPWLRTNGVNTNGAAD